MLKEFNIQSGDTVPLEEIQDEQPTSSEAETINETVRRIVSPPKEYRAKLKNLRKEWHKLRKTVKRFRIKIKETTVGKVPNKTLEIENAAMKTKLHEGRATGTQTKPIPIQPAIIKE